VHLEDLSYLNWPRDLNDINKKLLNQINEGEIKLNPLLKDRIIRRLQKKIVLN
jgi:hypothetical protein